jgi:peptidoglycan L-alanyl-D-glutamate endopeptidase CwlK
MEPRLSKISEQRLATCHRDLQVLFNHVIQYYDCSVVCGYRTKADQEKAFADGLSKVHYPGTHSTKPSIAVDVAPYIESTISWERTQSAHFAGYVLGVADRLWTIGLMKHRIRNGADWNMDHNINDTTFWDACHFELVLSDDEKRTLTYYEV